MNIAENNLRLLFIPLMFLMSVTGIYAQTDEDCMMCHEDRYLVRSGNGRKTSLFVNLNILKQSSHKNVKCIKCHEDANVSDFPHAKNLKNVNCGKCHKKENKDFYSGIHGKKLLENDLYAPSCKECHGTHNIYPPGNEKSLTYKMNIPALCGKCHREGAPVQRVYKISEHNILENYSQSIHGKGLFASGLIVTATCNNCHGNHEILPHTDKKSSVAPGNIAATCMKCHTKIDDVHKKVINKTLWQTNPDVIPSCSNCHPPHIVKITDTASVMSDASCLKCHGKKDLYKESKGKKISLYVEHSDINNYAHAGITCVKCHSDIRKEGDSVLCNNSPKTDCSNCHREISDLYFKSGHGTAYLNKNKNAPYCTDCHNTHKIKRKNDDTSPIFRSAVPELCGSCHKKDGQASKNADLSEKSSYSDYSKSVHGKGVTEKGLLVSAVCTDCHTAHYELKASDERSSVYRKNIPSTCAACHKGIYDEYIQSDHAINKNENKKFPVCVDCHSSHVISDVKQDAFMNEVMNQCGLCHKELAESYLKTYHGQAYKLGFKKSAKCSDCHGAHNILNMNNPESTINEKNIVATCRKCHKDANKKFTGYLTHATHYNRKKFPLLYYTYKAMTGLLVSVFLFFGIHTLLWFPRSLRERRKKKRVKTKKETKYLRRFTKSQSITHVFVIVSFLALALTGMTLKFSYMDWAKFTVKFLGQVKGAGTVHRIGAIITAGYFIYHIYSLVKLKKQSGQSFREFIFGPDSLMFNKQDLKDFVSSIKWFVGKGPKPEYGRWTYWEKFDYMAVFWGVAVIGSSGLMLWFPEFFSNFLPGRLINVAQIIHSDEALLAVGFIFTIHFFNTHLRPEAFPIDTVIFTGQMPLEEYKEDRKREYKKLEKSGIIKQKTEKKQFSEKKMKIIKFFGFFFLSFGIILVTLIIYSLLFG
ncbi:MAG: hypothetical protein GXO50_06055 [Chlorobi bacterium]|nr:hypothetical protein [Chlorobiota bacterium]